MVGPNTVVNVLVEKVVVAEIAEVAANLMVYPFKVEGDPTVELILKAIELIFPAVIPSAVNSEARIIYCWRPPP